jgi:chemotaxis protein methyltransferase CheR
VTGGASAQLVDRFARLVAERLGLHGDERLRPMLAEMLRRRGGAHEAAQSAWLAELAEQPEQAAAWLSLAPELTITETSFLRYREQFQAFAERAVPACLDQLPPGQPLRILSAGCASGDEAYSLAMCLFERWPQMAERAVLQAVDINAAALDKARAARYSPWALRQLPAAWRERWFHAGPQGFTLDPSVREAVRFEQRNLVAEDKQLWARQAWDIVFCRNVMMYFAPPQMAALVRRIEQALVPGGFLFLGDAETLRGLGSGLRPQQSHGCFYYQRPLGRPAATASPPVPPALPAEPAPMPPPRPAASTAAPHDERITEAKPSSVPSAPSPAGLAPVLEAMHAERFELALQLLESLPRAMADAPPALLLRAASLAHTGALRAAEQCCSRLLQENVELAGAHHVLALCRDAAGRTAEAMAQDRVATGLDPAFAMPHLHLGLLARRTGDTATARRELAIASELLEHEDPTRLLLFGGGFERHALIALCRAELASAEESR